MIYQPVGQGSFGPNGTDDRKNKSSDDWLWTYSTNTGSTKE